MRNCQGERLAAGAWTEARALSLRRPGRLLRRGLGPESPLQPAEQGLVAGVAPQRLEIGVVLDPFPVTEAVLHGTLQEIERGLGSARDGVEAGDVVEHAGIVRVERQRPVAPPEALFHLTQPAPGNGPEIMRAGVVGIQLDVTLRGACGPFEG